MKRHDDGKICPPKQIVCLDDRRHSHLLTARAEVVHLHQDAEIEMSVVQTKDGPALCLADERKDADPGFRRRVGLRPRFQPKWPHGKIAELRKPADLSR